MSCGRLENDALLADLGAEMDAHVEQCEDCRQRLRGYQHIARLIASGDSARRAPPGWRKRTLARIYPVPTWRRPRVAAVAAAATAAAVLVLVLLRPGHKPQPTTPNPELAMQIVEDGEWRAAEERAAPGLEQRQFVAHPGEVVRARALPADAAYFDIRVYRGERDLLLRCPDAGPPRCLDPAGAVFTGRDAPADAQRPSAVDAAARSLLIWKIPSVGTYQVLLLVSERPIAGPRGTLDDDVAAATAAGAQVVDMETIRVR